jgi:cytochrome c
MTRAPCRRGAALRPLAALVAAACVALPGCSGRDPPRREPLTGGDAVRGRELIARIGCGACHVVPGVERATGKVGPPLERLRERAYVGGVVSNTPDNLVAWIVNPRALSPRTAMPAVGVDAEQARDIAAYLYSR